MPPRPEGAFQHLVHLQASIALPARHLVSHTERDVQAIRLLCVERQRLGCGVGFGDVDIRPSLLCVLRKLRILVEHLEERIVAQASLFQLRCGEVDPSTVLTIEERTVAGDRRRQQGLSVLSPHDDERFSELPVPVCIEDPEQHRHQRPLPEFKVDQVRGKLALVVSAEVLDEPDSRPRLLGRKKERAFFQPFHDVLIPQPHPFPDNDRTVLDCLIIGQDLIHSASR